jgi:lipopolysaccharide/colanic/teichoic acid biosynthesis glycosyltransferase
MQMIPAMDRKRLFDLAVVCAAAILLLPVLLLTAALVRLFLGSPVFFRQIRPGRHAKPFRLLKFRSMHDARNSTGLPLPDRDRLSRFGRWLRSTSLDELPELWNVFRGDMSIVGPRPLLPEYLPLYSARQAERHSIKPGITGWAQVNGRNALSWEERFELDLWYVENQSFLLDLKIIWMTIGAALKREGVCHSGSATMEKFTGTASAHED